MENINDFVSKLLEDADKYNLSDHEIGNYFNSKSEW